MTYLHRLINALVSLKDGFSVVAPMSWMRDVENKDAGLRQGYIPASVLAQDRAERCPIGLSIGIANGGI